MSATTLNFARCKGYIFTATKKYNFKAQITMIHSYALFLFFCILEL